MIFLGADVQLPPLRRGHLIDQSLRSAIDVSRIAVGLCYALPAYLGLAGH